MKCSCGHTVSCDCQCIGGKCPKCRHNKVIFIGVLFINTNKK